MQGVWFRDSTRREALRLGITGYAINLDDGDVEVLACGTPEAIAELRAWLGMGPPMAAVSNVQESEADLDSPPDFRIG